MVISAEDRELLAKRKEDDKKLNIQETQQGEITAVESNKPKTLGTLMESESLPAPAPIVSSYDNRFRSLLNMVDKLRHLKLLEEDIKLPTIVVVGDGFSGKSSILESLTGIRLREKQPIPTRIPLIIELKNEANPDSEFLFSYNTDGSGKTVSAEKGTICEHLKDLTETLAGSAPGISDIPLTLTYSKKDLPNLTMVELPGFTRIPHGDKVNMNEQTIPIASQYIGPEKNNIILNVFSAGDVDFSASQSITMSQEVDHAGERTLAVFTQADKFPKILYKMVTAYELNVQLNYICVRNRIDEESNEKAREEEGDLFEKHHLLSQIEKAVVGIDHLAEKLVRLQANIIHKRLPVIVTKINEKLSEQMEELKKLPNRLKSSDEARTAFVHIFCSAKESLKKILIRREFDEYADVTNMHCTARLAEKLKEYSQKLQSQKIDEDDNKNFLMDEIKILEEVTGIVLPNFLPRSAFITLMQKKVKAISKIPIHFVVEIWRYIDEVVISVLTSHSEKYPQLMSSAITAAQNLIAKKKEESVKWARKMVENEMESDYTCDPEYTIVWEKLLSRRDDLMKILNDDKEPTKMNIDELGEIEVSHLRKVVDKSVGDAFDLKMRVTSYWKVVLKRMTDSMALHVLSGIRDLVNEDLEVEFLNHLGTSGKALERTLKLKESPSTYLKRNKLETSIKMLNETKTFVTNFMEMVANDFE